jgi:hypothetical protein
MAQFKLARNTAIFDLRMDRIVFLMLECFSNANLDQQRLRR